jgi:hypothetical protein
VSRYPARRIASLLGDYGPGWLLYRVRYAAARRLGLQARATPARPWAARPLADWLRPEVPSEPAAYAAWRAAHAAPFLFDRLPSAEAVGARAVADADALLAGTWTWFSGETFAAGFPPPWQRDPRDGAEWPHDRHWSQISDEGARDIKFVWEPSRFGSAFLLARAYARTRDDRYPEAFWRLVEDWAAANPPMLGPNWRCGQEASFRVMAWCFGLFAFAGAAATTPARVAALVAMLGWHGERIAANLAYARSQKNNHAISEGVGLWTIGLLFPELRQATAWRDAGHAVLAEEAERQIYDDGAYVQHSTNYHRLMLHDYCWAIALGRRNHRPLGDAVLDRVARATHCLDRLVEARSGGAPVLGHDDGALILPLSDAAYEDFRPAVQLAHACVLGARRYEAGPWDEPAAWLCADRALAAPTPPDPAGRPAPPFLAPRGGFLILEGPESRALLRCARFRDRPAHADQLHLDVWWRGANVACDAGTYLYTAADGWGNALAGTRTHNTVLVDDEDQMIRAGRFLWLDWARGTIESVASPDGVDVCHAVHHGYARRGVTHRRAVARVGDAWVVVDDLVGRGEHALRLQWLLADAYASFDQTRGCVVLDTAAGPFTVQAVGPRGARAAICRGDACDTVPDGWRARRYGVREPAHAFTVEGRARGPARFVSLLAPAPASMRVTDQGVEVDLGGARTRLQLAPTGSPVVVLGIDPLESH